MQNIGNLIRALRVRGGYPLRKVAAILDIDQAILSKIERGQRKIKKEQVVKLARFFNYNEKKMLITYLSDMIIYEIGNEEYAKEALKVAEEKIDYKTFKLPDRNKIINRIAKILKEYPEVSKAWMYGSFSRKDDGPGSDIDIAVKTNQGFSYFDLADIQFQLETALNRKIDIGFIDSFRPNILENVKKDLKLIYEKPKS
ncbi:MAG: nucleotidyltransferase domain-containing protein [Bacteroidales bacterium]|nr:nucleotidyltransferase domain-containing protein [Bacteroidales bacterium]